MEAMHTKLAATGETFGDAALAAQEEQASQAGKTVDNFFCGQHVEQPGEFWCCGFRLYKGTRVKQLREQAQKRSAALRAGHVTERSALPASKAPRQAQALEKARRKKEEAE